MFAFINCMIISLETIAKFKCFFACSLLQKIPFSSYFYLFGWKILDVYLLFEMVTGGNMVAKLMHALRCMHRLKSYY